MSNSQHATGPPFPSPGVGGRIRPELIMLHGQLEQVKQLAMLSEQRAAQLEVRLLEQETVNRDMMEYLSTTGSIHLVQTPSRSFAGGPYTPMESAHTRGAADYAQRVIDCEIGTPERHRAQPPLYTTPSKPSPGSGRGGGHGFELHTPNRPPSGSGAGHRGYPPQGFPSGAMSPGLSPIVRDRASGGRSRGAHGPGHTTQASASSMLSRRSPPAQVQARIMTNSLSVSNPVNNSSSSSGECVESAGRRPVSSGVRAIPMPDLNAGYGEKVNLPHKRTDGSIGDSSDDSSAIIPAYGYISKAANNVTGSPPSSPAGTPTMLAYTPPRTQKPLTPAPRSQHRVPSTEELEKQAIGLQLNYGDDGSIAEDIPSSDDNSSVRGSSQGPQRASSRESGADYSYVFEDEACGASESSVVRETPDSMSSINGDAPLSHSLRYGRNASDVADMTEKSLQMISLLDISSGTMRSMASAANTTIASHSQPPQLPLASEAHEHGVQSADTEAQAANNHTSLSFSLSNSNVVIDRSGEKRFNEAGIRNRNSHTKAAEEVEKVGGESDAPVGIAFAYPTDATTSTVPTHTRHVDILNSPAGNINQLDIYDGSSSENSPAVRDAMMSESLDIDWTFVKSPTEQPDQSSPAKTSMGTAGIVSNTPAQKGSVSRVSTAKAASRYDAVSHSGDSDSGDKPRMHSLGDSGSKSPSHAAPTVAALPRREEHVAFEDSLHSDPQHSPPVSKREPRSNRRDRAGDDISRRSNHRKSTEKRRSSSQGRSGTRSSAHGHSSKSRDGRDYNKRKSWPPPQHHHGHRSRSRGREVPPDYWYHSFPAFGYSFPPPPPMGFPYYLPPAMYPSGFPYGPEASPYRRSRRRPSDGGYYRHAGEAEDTYSSDASTSEFSSASSDLTSESYSNDGRAAVDKDGYESESHGSRHVDENNRNRLHKDENKPKSRLRKHVRQESQRRTHRRNHAFPTARNTSPELSPEFSRQDYTDTFAQQWRAPVRTTSPLNAGQRRQRQASHDDATVPSYHIPPPLQSPTFHALKADRLIRLHVNGKYSEKTSLHALVNTFKKTYQSYSSPVSGASGILSANSTNRYWRRQLGSLDDD